MSYKLVIFVLGQAPTTARLVTRSFVGRIHGHIVTSRARGGCEQNFGLHTSLVRMCFGSGVTFSQLAALVDALEVTSPSFFWELARLDPERTVDGVANEFSETRRSLRCLAASKAAATTCSDWRRAPGKPWSVGNKVPVRNYSISPTHIKIYENQINQ